MAFSNNLRGLRSVAMAVLMAGSMGSSPEISLNGIITKPSDKGQARPVAGNKSGNKLNGESSLNNPNARA